jgi:hypothetical protein
MSLTTDSPLTRKVAAACGAAVLLFAASACGSDDKNGNATGQTSEQGGPQSRQQGGQFPGANGRVAAVADRTAQVQGMDGQVAVTWTAATTFTKDVTAALADVKVGSCVLVGSGDQPSTGSTPATEVTATSVRITPKTNGSCGAAMRGPGGGPGGSGPQLDGTPPEGAPSGGQRPQVRALGGAFGEVTAVSAGGFTVAAVTPGGSDTRTVAVEVGAGTTYTTTAKAAPSDVKVGVCIAANGSTDDTGAVTARTIAVSQPQDGQCGGFMRFASGGPAGAQES